MEGLLFTVAVIVALVAAIWLAVRRRPMRGPRRAQDHEPPGQRSAPDDWPRDGGDNPSAP